jgi:hypothetical protein
MIFLRQSTASQEILLGPFVDSTNGDSEEGGLTIANTDIHIWMTGATTLAHKNSGGATYISNGLYYAVLDATDTATIGPMRIDVHVAGALAVVAHCCVLDEAVYDVLFGTTAPATLTAADVNAQCDTAISDAAIPTAVLAGTVEGTTTLTQSLRLMMSALFGKVSGAPTGPIVFRDIGDTKPRISATVDADGNRTAVTKDAT